MKVALNINGTSHSLTLEPRVTLLDALRENIGLTGSKKGCDRGQCGACTAIVDGRRVLSCLTLAATCEGTDVTTIEGLARGSDLHPMQTAFIKHDGFQCGYCTPGQICSAIAVLNEAKNGEAKVTGAAKYAAEFQVNNPAHRFLVMSTVAKGRITAIDTIGIPAAIANAVFHATGKRDRDLPIAPDKLIM